MTAIFMDWLAHQGRPLLPHISEDHRRNSADHHQHPHHRQHPHHSLPAGDNGDALRPQHRHQPVDAHEHDELDGGVHVDQTQVEEDLTHRVPKHPLLQNQVDDEERGEGHQRAIGNG